MSRSRRRPGRFILIATFLVAFVSQAAGPAKACWFCRRQGFPRLHLGRPTSCGGHCRICATRYPCQTIQPPWTCQPPTTSPPIDFCHVYRKFKGSDILDNEYSSQAEAEARVAMLHQRGYEARCACYSDGKVVATCGRLGGQTEGL
jgi:hypothetical protein